MEQKIRLSTYYLGIQLFTLFFNGTGWDSIGFSYPFWILYFVIREFEKKQEERLLCIQRDTVKRWITLIIWGTYSSVRVLFLLGENGALKIAVYYLVAIIFFLFVVDSNLNTYEIDFLLKAYVIMAVLVSILLLIQQKHVPTYTNRYSIIVGGKIKDPNYLSAYLIYPFLYSLHKFLKNERVQNLVISIVIALAILLTGSRASFLALAFGIVIIVTYSIGLKKMGQILLVAIIGLVILKRLIPEDLLKRFIDFGNYNDGSNRLRYNIWKSAFHIWQNNKLFGLGHNAVFNHGVEYRAYLHMMTHSTWLDILAELGLLGFGLFIISPIKLMIIFLRNRNVLGVATLTTTLITASIISAQYSQYYWFNIAIMASIAYGCFHQSYGYLEEL